MIDKFNAQDEFVLLVEDCRLGKLGKPVARYDGFGQPQGTRFVPHRPDFDVNCPVFYVGRSIEQIDGDVVDAVSDAIQNGSFGLPFEKFCHFGSIPGGSPSLAANNKRFQELRHNYVLLVEQQDDVTINITPLMKNAGMDHWSRQVFDCQIQLEEQSITCMPIANNYATKFLDAVQESLQDRLLGLMTDIHRLMHGSGAATPAIGAALTVGVQKRRAKMQLAQIETVRIIDFTAPPVTTVHSGIKRIGGAKRPHVRRGTFVREHTRQGTIIPAHNRRGTKVRGGIGQTPPWYEVIR